MVNPHAPAAASASICATLATDPAAITGPLDAATTALVSSAASAVGCRYASRSRPDTPASAVICRALSAISVISPVSTLGCPVTVPGNGQYRTPRPASTRHPSAGCVPPSTQSTPISAAAATERSSSSRLVDTTSSITSSPSLRALTQTSWSTDAGGPMSLKPTYRRPVPRTSS